MKGIGISLAFGELSQRESEVLHLASLGCKDSSIGYQLGIAAGTLGTYWARIRNKTSLVSRSELVVAYTQFHSDIVMANVVELIAQKLIKGATDEASHAGQIFFELPIAGAIINSNYELTHVNRHARHILEPFFASGNTFIELASDNSGDLLRYIFQEDLSPVAQIMLPIGPEDVSRWTLKRIGTADSALMISQNWQG